MAEWDHNFELGDAVEAKAWLYDVSVVGRIVQLSNTQAWLDGVHKPFKISDIKKVDTPDMTTAEANETKFRRLLEEAYYVIANMKTIDQTIINLRYRILDTLNETPSVTERQGIIDQVTVSPEAKERLMSEHGLTEEDFIDSVMDVMHPDD